MSLLIVVSNIYVAVKLKKYAHLNPFSLKNVWKKELSVAWNVLYFTGTGNGLANGFTGTKDPSTAALHIATGMWNLVNI